LRNLAHKAAQTRAGGQPSIERRSADLSLLRGRLWLPGVIVAGSFAAS